MKRVVAIIQPFKLPEVEEALRKVGISGINMSRRHGIRQSERAYRDLLRH